MKPKIRLVPVTQLVLDDKNANKGTKRGRELLEGSLAFLPQITEVLELASEIK